MTAVRAHNTKCDGCKTVLPGRWHPNHRAARLAAQQAGWIHIGGHYPRDYCNNCRGGRA